MLNIKVSRQPDKTWIADCHNLPGMPPVGKGATIQEAIGSLMILLSTAKSPAWEQLTGKIRIETEF